MLRICSALFMLVLYGMSCILSSGSLWTWACRKLEPDDILKRCEPILKNSGSASLRQWMKGCRVQRLSNDFLFHARRLSAISNSDEKLETSYRAPSQADQG